MWALKMKPLPRERWETVFDRRDIWGDLHAIYTSSITEESKNFYKEKGYEEAQNAEEQVGRDCVPNRRILFGGYDVRRDILDGRIGIRITTLLRKKELDLLKRTEVI